MRPLNQLTASEAVQQISQGKITSEQLVRACLDRIDEREKDVKAWEYLDPDLALKQAKACDSRPHQGLLHGIPVGVKDTMDTFDMPTTCGSPIYQGHQPDADAACVALAREHGAVIMGKTVATEFAAITPGKTANPHNLAHTPGGSSSGSAAAVGDFMIPLAFGSQTVGSNIRPAIFCGVVGFKPSYGEHALAGVKAQAHSMDTLGTMARSVEDIALLRSVTLGSNTLYGIERLDKPPVVGICYTHYWSEVEPITVKAMEKAVAVLSSNGAEMRNVELSETFKQALDAQWYILQFEFFRNLTFERNHYSDQFSVGLQKLMESASKCTLEGYFQALETANKARAEIDVIFNDIDVLLTPSALGEAPKHGPRNDLVSAQIELSFQRLWTLLYLPCITLPLLTGENGLPVGVQFVGRYRADSQLLNMTHWAEQEFQKTGV